MDKEEDDDVDEQQTRLAVITFNSLEQHLSGHLNMYYYEIGYLFLNELIEIVFLGRFFLI